MVNTLSIDISSAGDAGSFFYTHGDRVEIIKVFTTDIPCYLRLIIKADEVVRDELEDEGYEPVLTEI